MKNDYNIILDQLMEKISKAVLMKNMIKLLYSMKSFVKQF